MKKKLGMFAGLVLFVVLMAACAADSSQEESDSGDSNSSGSEDSSAENQDTTEISFIHWRGEDEEVFDDIIGQFEEENPGISVQMNTYPSEQYQSNAQQMLRDGSTGDVFTSFPGTQFETINNAGFFTDLSDEEFVNNFAETSLEVGQSEGSQLAVPYQMVFNMPVYNKGMFEELGIEVPTSWSEYQAMAETLKENDITPIAFPGADIGPNQMMNSMMMNNAKNEDIFAQLESGEETLTNDWWINTLEDFQHFNENGYLQEDALGTNQDSAMQMVADEEAAMLATGSYHMASLKELNSDLELGFLPPITVSEEEVEYEGIHTATFMLAVNKNSEKKEEAKAFIEFLSQPDIASQYANETGQHLTVNDVDYESESLQNTSHWIDEKDTRFQPRYLIKEAAVEDAVLGSIENVLGGTSPEEAADEAQQVVEENID
ncbi:ABC transporter substrate-binding protein [Salibacterium qingdaonense]|uniref:Carbohydrate ABC transporter substrate-binding protein, CUT1 family (TC 3.A.1.1.-) n=1 Tax=Salibacterium qingdaonense TaxID=266892 RepID=A0A1I4NJ16_9BACI|nr:extracellular solute-binding protein [Salibacterium qingdaonense]SFM15514.1 carbohydrate ABC transporter substrate-binding protein, CUT1 family (TC 3.A.1.1.-) [Salibacterium qingdaonense]